MSTDRTNRLTTTFLTDFIDKNELLERKENSSQISVQNATTWEYTKLKFSTTFNYYSE